MAKSDYESEPHSEAARGKCSTQASATLPKHAELQVFRMDRWEMHEILEYFKIPLIQSTRHGWPVTISEQHLLIFLQLNYFFNQIWRAEGFQMGSPQSAKSQYHERLKTAVWYAQAACRCNVQYPY